MTWVASCDTCGWEQACNQYAAAGAAARDHGVNCPDPYTRVYERAGFYVQRMTGTLMRHPWIVIDPTCPPGRHPTRDCRCEVFRSEREAAAYAAEQNASAVAG